jgi:transcriptional regulator with XRE-family HTH domain
MQHTISDEPAAGARRAGALAMMLGERLKLVRGTVSQKAFAALLGVHENTVSNAERRGSATQEFLLRIAEVQGINLHWLLTGRGAMRVGADGGDGSLLQEKLTLALADALRVAYGPRHASVPLDLRARAVRAGVSYLRAIGVTEDTLPDQDALVKLVRLTLDVMRQAQ